MSWGALPTQTPTQEQSGAAAPRWRQNLPCQLSPGSPCQPWCVNAMSPLHHKRGPNLSSFQGSSGVTLALCKPANKRAAPKSVENTSEMDRKPNNKVGAGCSGVTPTSPPHRGSRWVFRPPQLTPLHIPQKLRRCWRALSEMEEWKLTLLLYISSLSLWGLCVVVLPCAPTLLAILGLGIFTIWCPKSQGKVGVRPAIAPNTPLAGVSPGPSLRCSGGSPFWEGAANSGHCPPSQAFALEPPSHPRWGTRPGTRDTPVPVIPVTLPGVLVSWAGTLLAEGRHPALTRGLLSGDRGPLRGRALGEAGGRTR